MKQMTLIDTSIWIEYFRGKSAHTEFIEAGLNDGSVYITGPIISELLQGVKSEKEFDMLASCVDAIPFLECETIDWMNTGKLSFNLRKKGITVPITDSLIAVIASRYKMRILTLDNHFKKIPDVKLV